MNDNDLICYIHKIYVSDLNNLQIFTGYVRKLMELSLFFFTWLTVGGRLDRLGSVEREVSW